MKINEVSPWVRNIIHKQHRKIAIVAKSSGMDWPTQHIKIPFRLDFLSHGVFTFLFLVSTPQERWDSSTNVPSSPLEALVSWAVPKLEPRGAQGALPCKASCSGTTLLPFRSIFKQKKGFLKLWCVGMSLTSRVLSIPEIPGQSVEFISPILLPSCQNNPEHGPHSWPVQGFLPVRLRGLAEPARDPRDQLQIQHLWHPQRRAGDHPQR